MTPGIVYLKIKLKSLAAESRFIRREELKRRAPRKRTFITQYGKDAFREPYNEALRRWLENPRREAIMATRKGLYDHRRDVVRKEARGTHVAYAYLRGKVSAEAKMLPYYQWDAVTKMVNRYGTAEQAAGFDAWRRTQVPGLVPA